MSRRELIALNYGKRELIQERRLRSGTERSDSEEMSSGDGQSELEELRQQLELAKSQLESKDHELYVANNSLLEAEVKVQEVRAAANQLEEQQSWRLNWTSLEQWKLLEKNWTRKEDNCGRIGKLTRLVSMTGRSSY